MTDFPLPAAQPDAFLVALTGCDNLEQAAQRTGCVVHPLASSPGADLTDLAGLHAAGARALAASLVIGDKPMLLTFDASAAFDSYETALARGLMSYERIHVARTRQDLALILILPPTGTSLFWKR